MPDANGAQFSYYRNNFHSSRKSAICEHQASNDWFSYDDDIVKRVKFVNKNNPNVLTKFMKSAAILFYVNYTAVPVHSNNLCEHNENDETQENVDADADSSSSSSTVSSSSPKDLTPQLILGYIHFANAEFCLLCSSSTFDNYCCAAGRHANHEEGGSNNAPSANQYGRRGAHSYCTLQ